MIRLRDLTIGTRIGRIFGQNDALTGKESDRLDRIHQLRGVLFQPGPRQPRQAHFLFGAGTDKGCNRLGTFQRYPHRILTIDQQGRS